MNAVSLRLRGDLFGYEVGRVPHLLGDSQEDHHALGELICLEVVEDLDEGHD